MLLAAHATLASALLLPPHAPQLHDDVPLHTCADMAGPSTASTKSGGRALNAEAAPPERESAHPPVRLHPNQNPNLIASD
jgi:hypothetical protein